MDRFSILIVDDEIDFLETTVKRIRKRRIECEGVNSGEAAIQKIKTGKFDVVLLDVRMAGMDGIETLKEIKRITPLVEVVLLTGHASMESGIEGMKLGAFDYLLKPMELDPLLEKLREANEKKVIEEERRKRLGHNAQTLFQNP